VAASATESSDRLIWLAAGGIAAMGLVWLLIESPWSGASESALPPAAAIASGVSNSIGLDTDGATTGAAAARPPAAGDSATDALTTDEDPLYLARLALEAGMLVEPPEYSAWTLFGEAAAADPSDTQAGEGLEQVASALLGRGRTALEQGRLDDAEAVATTITDRLPEHPGALALARDVVVARTPPPPVEPVIPRRVVPATPPEPAPADRIPGLHADFLAAMGRNAVLTPSGANARDFVTEMLALAPDHELSVAARELIVTEMLDRSVQSLEALDAVAAQTWIDSATPLVADPARIARAQDRVTRQLIETESRKLLPASALERLVGAEPQYPQAALSRDIEGWVDVEFVVSPEGNTETITVVDASHERYFQAEAVAAVAQWRFKPVVFMGQPIPQRAYTRLAFVLD